MTLPSAAPPQAASAPAAASEAIDVQGMWRTVLRRRWLVIPFFVATVVVTMVVTLRQTRIYDATTTIVIDLNAPKVLDQVQDVVETGTGGYWFSREYYETQYKILASRAVAQRVADRLALHSNLKFLGLEGIQDREQQEQLRKGMDPVALLQRSLRIEPVKDSRIVRIRFESRDPQLAAMIANAFAEAYIAENLAVKSSTTQNASEWLEEQLADLDKKLKESGRALFEFKKAHDIVATSWDDRQSMVSQRLTAVNDALSRARVRRAELEAKNDSMAAAAAALDRDELGPEALAVLGDSTDFQALKLRYLDVRSECADLKLKYLGEHPKVEGCTERLRLAREGLRDQVKQTIDGARTEYQQVVITERKLVGLLNEAKSEAFNLNQYERDYLEFKRAYDNNQRLYDTVLKRLKDTGVTGMLQISNVRILDPARPSSAPIRPDPIKNGAFAIVLGLLGGIALAFLAEYVDSSITSQEQIEQKLSLAFLGIVPSVPANKDGTPQDLVVYTQPKSATAECLRAIRTNLLFMSPEKPLRTILVTSSGPQEGKTTTATSLAITMTTSGNRVLLVDADMRRPRLHRIFGLENSAGVSSLILGEGHLHEMVKATGIPNLSLLTCGPVPPNPAELLHTAAFRKLIAEMAASYDRVIIDSPPVGVVADAVVIATHVDGSLIVLRASRTSRDVAKHAVKQLRDVNAPLFGAVLNDLDLENQKYGQYSYYYRYGYYYGDKQEPKKAQA